MKLPEIEISIKYKGTKKTELKKIESSKDAAAVFCQLFDPGLIDWCEEFIMLSMNRKNKVIGYYRVSRGGTGATVVDPKVIATIALQSAATQIMIAHNHPSGDPAPSRADVAITERLKNGLGFLDIDLIDHMIITSDPNIYYSFRDEGMI